MMVFVRTATQIVLGVAAFKELTKDVVGVEAVEGEAVEAIVTIDTAVAHPSTYFTAAISTTLLTLYVVATTLSKLINLGAHQLGPQSGMMRRRVKPLQRPMKPAPDGTLLALIQLLVAGIIPKLAR